MKRLSGKQRSRIDKRFIRNMSVKEIAEEEGVSYFSVRECINAGLDKLASGLAETGRREGFGVPSRGRRQS